jgi:sec-independent protein translocase protein TatB
VFDVGLPELLVLVLAALFIFGPDRLPQVTAQAVRALRQLRVMASGAREQLTDAITPDLEDLDVLKDLRDLNQLGTLRRLDPRSMITSALLDDPDSASTPSNGSASPRRSSGATRRNPTGKSAPGAAGGEPATPPPATFDPDAT